jgi:hypothetical protein
MDARSHCRKKMQRAAVKPYHSINALADPVHAARMLFYRQALSNKSVFADGRSKREGAFNRFLNLPNP